MLECIGIEGDSVEIIEEQIDRVEKKQRKIQGEVLRNENEECVQMEGDIKEWLEKYQEVRAEKSGIVREIFRIRSKAYDDIHKLEKRIRVLRKKVGCHLLELRRNQLNDREHDLLEKVNLAVQKMRELGEKKNVDFLFLDDIMEELAESVFPARKKEIKVDGWPKGWLAIDTRMPWKIWKARVINLGGAIVKDNSGIPADRELSRDEARNALEHCALRY